LSDSILKRFSHFRPVPFCGNQMIWMACDILSEDRSGNEESSLE
jgi:hypothetical protein